MQSQKNTDTITDQFPISCNLPATRNIPDASPDTEREAVRRCRVANLDPPCRLPHVYVLFSRAFLPHAVFFVLLLVGLWHGELRLRSAAIFFALWLAAVLAAPLVTPGTFWMTAFVALMDVVLILMVVKRDVRIH
jgi:hypothetical protein